MKSTFCLIFSLIFTLVVLAQKKSGNALLYPKLVISDVVAIDSTYFFGFGYAKDFNKQAINEINYVNNVNLAEMLVKKMTLPGTDIYENYSPYKDVYFGKYKEIFVKIPHTEILSSLGASADTIMKVDDNGELEKAVIQHNADTSEIQALFFFDEWFFDEASFSFSKKVLAYSPIRKYGRNGLEDEEEWRYRKVGFFVAPELKKRKYKKIQKRMKLLAHVKYEFSIDNKELFGNREDDLALFTEDLDAPNWNSYARQNFRKLLIDRVLSQKSKAYDYYTGNLLSLEKLKAQLGNEKFEVVTIDPETGDEKIIEYETEIVNEFIKSVIFIEDWYIDPQTMLIDKRVTGIAPVRFTEDMETGNIEKKVAFVLYFDK
ncbi:MAG: hypothetical protein P1P88_25825 [Bacteroidales bacterium]|nr:hypothetical protein [Bacteroidales bacterium]